MLTKIDFKNSMVKYLIKKKDQSELCFMPLEDFISMFETSTVSTTESLDLVAAQVNRESLEYILSLGL